MRAKASQITSPTIVYSTVHSDSDQRKHQSPASLAFLTGEFYAQRASNAEDVSIWWRHHEMESVGVCIHTFIDEINANLCEAASIIAPAQYLIEFIHWAWGLFH